MLYPLRSYPLPFPFPFSYYIALVRSICSYNKVVDSTLTSQTARQMASSQEFLAFRKSYNILVKSVDPDHLAPVLYSNGLLSRTAYEKTKASIISLQRVHIILKDLEKRILVNPLSFYELLDVLKNESPAMKAVGEKMQGYNNTK